MLAYCGLNCENCDIYKAANDKDLAIKFANEMKNDGHDDANPDWFVCQGCKGADDLCWSENCHMRKCCREKDIENCAQCDEFPCETVISFENDGGRHEVAVKLLRSKVGEK